MTVMEIPHDFHRLILFAAAVNALPQIPAALHMYLPINGTQPTYPTAAHSASLASSSGFISISTSSSSPIGTNGYGAVAAYYGQTTAGLDANDRDP